LFNAIGQKIVRSVARACVRALCGQLHRFLRYIPLAQAAVTRDVFDYAAALIARGEVAQYVSRIGPQFGLDQAYGFENLGEFDSRKSAKAAKSIGGGNALGGFTRVLATDQFGNGRFQALFHPALDRRQRVFLVLKLFDQGGDEIRLQRDGFGFEEAAHPLESFRRTARTRREAVGPKVGSLAKMLTPADARGQLREGVNQRHPQQQGEQPQLRDGQRLRFLAVAQPVRNAVLGERLARLRDQILGHSVTRSQPFEFLRMVAGKVAANLRNVGSDEVRVIQHPLGGRRECVTEARRFHQIAASELKHNFVRVQPG
jgi:hypothetical protein